MTSGVDFSALFLWLSQEGFILKLKKINFSPKILFAVIPAGMILAGGTVYLYSRSSSRMENYCEQNVQRLASLETSDITRTEQLLKDLKAQDAAKKAVEEAPQAPITLLTDIQIKQVFQGSVIVGDSITESIVEYGFLDTDVVVCKRGLRIDEATPQLETSIKLHPQTLFLSFGANDLELYEGDSSRFIDAYRVQVQKLKDSLPDVPIYINSILPVLPETIEQIPALGYYPEFNQALADFCAEMGCTYIDNSPLVEGDQNMYEPDGEHVIRDYYPRWLTHMAETAGLI